jgi:predicted transcriptional regulator
VTRRPRVIVLSIRTEHLDRILSGAKAHEFRRRRVAASVGDEILVYEPSPVRMITASFVVAEVVHAPPKDLLQLESDSAARAGLAGYLSGAAIGTALRIRGARRLARPLPLAAAGLMHAPQSYAFARPALM